MSEFFKTYQTLIVGFLGFLGVMTTLWWNARLQRKQEERRERREASALRMLATTGVVYAACVFC